MSKKRRQQELERQNSVNTEEVMTLKRQSLKDLIAPSGIDASNIDHLEIISSVKSEAKRS